MKKIILLSGICAFGLLLFVASCQPKDGTAKEVATTTDSVKFEKAFGDFSVKAVYPNDTTSALTKAVNEYLSEAMGGSYEGSYAQSMPILKYYLNAAEKKDSAEYAELMKENPNDERGWKYEYMAEIEKAADAPQYLTYLYTCYEYTGGAHGSTLVTGQTFRKSDGRRIGWDVFANTNDDAFQQLMKEGLKKYFNVKTDEELKGMLMNENDIYLLPLPQCPPLFTVKGVRFVYGQYEITPYAAGTPDFTIPYAKLGNNMMVTAKRLIK
ncbi:MAG: DUF3298 and DUF4163 domain-containing protein [Prevotella sp.]|jgi:hypothetical protein|nr:DUF3298 and DUF4163 domain-containing protein [Prevotella sp.]